MMYLSRFLLVLSFLGPWGNPFFDHIVPAAFFAEKRSHYTIDKRDITPWKKIKDLTKKHPYKQKNEQQNKILIQIFAGFKKGGIKLLKKQTGQNRIEKIFFSRPGYSWSHRPWMANGLWCGHRCHLSAWQKPAYPSFQSGHAGPVCRIRKKHRREILLGNYSRDGKTGSGMPDRQIVEVPETGKDGA